MTDNDNGSAARLRRYWLVGEGAIKIRWGTPGDFTRCVRNLRGKMRDPEGYCAELHFAANGFWPGDRRNLHASESEMPNPQPDAIDRIRAAWNETAPQQQWITEVHDGHVIVCDETDRSFARVPVTVDGDRIEFGEPVKVLPGYVDADQLVEASAVYASAAESRPTVPPVEPAPEPAPQPTPEPDDPENPPADPEPAPQPPAAEPDNAPTDPKEGEGHVSTLSTDVRNRLGLPDDASDADVLAALDSVKAKADTAPTDEQIAASAAADAKREELEKEVAVMASTLAEVTAKLAAAEQAKAATVKASVLDDAVKQGKIRPADRDQWAKDYDDAPAAVTRVLASIAPGTAVPVSPTGYTGSTETTADEDAEWEALVSRLDGPTAAKGA